MSLLAIGDIHGFTKPLRSLIDVVAPSASDTLVFLGDYVDKGPDVSGTLDFLISLQKEVNCIFLRGNHDQLLLNACHDPMRVSIWESIAGDDPLGSYGGGQSQVAITKIPTEHIHFLENRCRNFFETDDYIFVHGGIRSNIDPVDEEVERLHWTSLSAAAPHLSGKTVVCGHSSQESGKIADLGHTICVDTGITSGGNLTCLNLDDFSFEQISSALERNSGQLSSRRL